MLRHALLISLLSFFTLVRADGGPAVLIQQADQARLRHKFADAVSLYRAALFADDRLPILERNRILLNLAHCEKEQGNLESSKELITAFLKSEVLPVQRIEATFLLARVCFGLGHFEEAYMLLKLAETAQPKEEWARDDILLLSRLILLLDDRFELALTNGQLAFHAANYDQALTCYQLVLSAVEKGAYPASVRLKQEEQLAVQLRCRIGETLWLKGSPQGVIQWLTSCGDAGPRAAFLLGLAHKATSQPAIAISYFSTYLTSPLLSAEECEETTWHLGHACFQDNRLKEARSHLVRLVRDYPQGARAVFAKVCIARIDQKEARSADAATKIKQVASLLTPTDPLLPELAYLRGEQAYSLALYRDAIEFFEEAVNSPLLISDRKEGLQRLGLSYAQLANQQDEETKEILLNKAAHLLQQCLP